MSPKWDSRFLDLCDHIATWSRDPSTKCGSVIVRPDKTIASMGFNGFPKGCSDDEALYEEREEKYQRIIHAETNALLHAQESLQGYTLYVSPLPPCDRCSTLIIQAGITTVAYRPVTLPARWKDAMDRAAEMYAEAGVQLRVVAS